MKTKHFFWMLAALVFTGCSQSDDHDPALPENGEKSNSYVAVQIKATGEATRTTDEDFDPGTDAEKDVKSAHFFFFTASGAPYAVNSESYTTSNTGKDNYIVIPVTSTPNTSPANIEAIVEETLVIQKSKNAEFPAQIVAVLNWDYTGNGLTLTQLSEQLITEATLQSGKGFLMSNSVFVNDAGKVIDATPLTQANIGTSAELNNLTPVTIYVERVAAKVAVAGKEELFDTGESIDVAGVDTKVYAKLIGWDLNSTINNAYLIKKVDAAWTDATLGFDWNEAINYRSYWAQSVPVSTSNPIDKSFSYNSLSVAPAAATYAVEFTEAAPKVIVAAQLVEQDGTPMEVAVWYGARMAGGEDALKTAVANSLSNLRLFDGNATYTAITPAQIKCVAVTTNTQTAKEYQVTFALADGVTTTNWFLYNPATGSYTPIDANAELAKVVPGMIYKEGRTYYYTDIKHLGEQFGVVRNHSYKINITKVEGLGTPVFDPTQDYVEPVKPSETEAYISAEINILAWRIVSNDVVLQ